jgi:transposase-like protein
MTSPEKTTPALELEQVVPRDALRELVALTVQEALDQEFTAAVGAEPYARTSTRRTWRNGSYDRQLTTRVGMLTLKIPRDRDGIFQPSLFARYERTEQALVLAMVEMYFQGVSTRKVTDVVELLCGRSVSASEVSTLTRKLDVALAAWRQRRLNEHAYPYLIVDALVERVRREGHVRHTALLYVMGIRPDGYRELLGTWLGAAESADSWGHVFHDLTERGLHGVHYVVSDEHLGLVQSIRRYFPEAVHQRCQVHYLRNALAKVSNDALQQEVTRGLADAWAAPTRAEALRRLQALGATLRPRTPKLADWLDDTSEDTLGVYALEDDELRKKLRSTNALERHHKEVRRRTRVVGIFPHEASLLRLVTALAIDSSEKWSTKRYLNLSRLSPKPQEVPRLQSA